MSCRWCVSWLCVMQTEVSVGPHSARPPPASIHMLAQYTWRVLQGQRNKCLQSPVSATPTVWSASSCQKGCYGGLRWSVENCGMWDFELKCWHLACVSSASQCYCTCNNGNWKSLVSFCSTKECTVGCFPCPLCRSFLIKNRKWVASVASDPFL